LNYTRMLGLMLPNPLSNLK